MARLAAVAAMPRMLRCSAWAGMLAVTGRYFSVEYSLVYEGQFNDGLPADLPYELRVFEFIGDETPEPEPPPPPEPKKGAENLLLFHMTPCIIFLLL